MDSMTKEELEDPEIMNNERVERIAKGSGRSLTEMRELIKQYRQSKKMLKMMKGKDPDKLMKNLGSMQGKMKFK
jgi:signal recognition particle subunit SRP54